MRSSPQFKGKWRKAAVFAALWSALCLLRISLSGANDEPVILMPPPPPGAAATLPPSNPNPHLLPDEPLVPPPSPAGTSASAGSLVAAAPLSVSESAGADLPLAAPGNLTALPENAEVFLSWDAPAGSLPISGYLIYRSTASGAMPVKPINRHPVTDLTSFLDNRDNSLSPPDNRHVFYYRVRAFDADLRLSDYSVEAAAQPSGPLMPPARVQALPGDGAARLTWSEPISSGAYDLAGYLIYRSTVSGAPGAALLEKPQAGRAYDDFGLVNGQSYFYTLQSVDDQGNTSVLSQEVPLSPYKLAAAPTELTAEGIGDNLIKLSWKASAGKGTFPVQGYNIYRSVSSPVDVTQPPVNKALCTDLIYEDGPEFSVTAPAKGISYHYVVAAVDGKGNPSLASAEVSAAPVESLRSLANIGNISLPGESSLSISGRKTVNMGYSWNANLDGAPSTQPSGFTLDQQLQVRLQGKVGRKITVDVDYDDKTTDKHKISIIYSGDRDEIVEDASFGDIRLDLPRTEFAGYDKNLFGIKLRLHSPNNRLRFQAVGAQTQGITETKRFIGNQVPDMNGNIRGRDIQDTQFIAYRYYYLSKDPRLFTPISPTSATMQYSIARDSVRIWMDRQSFNDRSRPDAKLSSPNGTYAFIFMNPGVDYSIDYNTGIVTFYAAVQPNYTISVAYAIQSNINPGAPLQYVGFAPGSTNDMDFNESNLGSSFLDGITSDSKHSIQAGVQNTGSYDSHMVFQFYDLGNKRIYPPKQDPNFIIQVYSKSNVPLGLPGPNVGGDSYYLIDADQGLLEFRAPFPFKLNPTNSGNPLAPLQELFSEPFDNTQNDVYNKSLTSANSNYRIHIEYQYRVASYNLHFSIIRGSETVTVDGRKLTRDTEYFLDYDTGILVFSNPDIVKPDSVVEATYEYSPFGGQFSTNLGGVRAEYDATDRLSLGTTFLYNGNASPIQAPEVRASPFQLMLLDADAKLFLPSDLVSRLASTLALGHKVDFPVEITMTAEAAHSWFLPNTFSQNGENGVAMIDDFESVDNVASVSIQDTSWSPASMPLPTTSQETEGAFTPTADRRRFSWRHTVQVEGHDKNIILSQNNGADPRKSQLEIDFAHFDFSDNWDAFVYSLSRLGQNLHDYSNLQMWIKTNQPVTMYVDVGVVNMDANGNGLLDRESPTGVLDNPNEDVGIGNGIFQAPNSGLYVDNAYWGAGNKRYDTEDLDGVGVLETQDRYYEFAQDIGPVSDPTNNDYSSVTIPLPKGIPFPAGSLPTNPADPAYYNYIKHVRVWFRPRPGCQPAGNILLESLQVEGNRWQPRTTPNSYDANGDTVSTQVDTNKFRVSAISQQINANASAVPYVPNTAFFNTQQQGTDTSREQSLLLHYNLTSSDLDAAKDSSIYDARRLLTNGGLSTDFSAYKYLRLDVYKPAAVQHGEVLVLRLGADDANYLQYALNLDQVVPGGWHTLSVALDGSDGNRSMVGAAFLRVINQISFSIINPNSTVAAGGEDLWLDNLRVTDAQTREGTALKVRTNVSALKGAIQINHVYQEMDADFMQIDEQNLPPKQHTQTNSVDAVVSAFKSVPLSAHWDHNVIYTDEFHQNDPGYSGNFSYPNTTRDRLTFNTGISGVPNLTVGLTGSMLRERNEYVPAFKQQIRQNPLYTDFPALDPNNNHLTWQVNPTLTYTVPAFHLPYLKFIGLGGDRLSATIQYNEDVLLYDSPTDTTTPYYDRAVGTEAVTLRWDNSFKPFKWLSVVPGLGWNNTRSRWNVALPSEPVHAYNLGPNNFVNDYQEMQWKLNPTLTLDFSGLPGFVSPKINYNFTNARDDTANTLINSGSLGLQTGFKPWEWIGKGDLLPPVQINHTISVAAQFNDNYSVGANQADPSAHGVEKEWPGPNFQQGIWWVRLDTLRPGQDMENLSSPDNIENWATTSSKRTDTQASMPLNFKGIGLSPHFTYSTDREAPNGQANATTAISFSYGSGMDIATPAFFPLAKLLKPANFHFQYDFSQSKKDGAQAEPVSLTLNHAYSLSLPNKPTENLTLTLEFSGSNATTLNYQPGGNYGSSADSYRLGLRTTYLLGFDRPLRLWNMWPFNGKELRLTQKFQLDNNVSAELHKNYGNGLTLGTASDTSLYEMTNGVTYNVLTNVQANLAIKNDYFKSNIFGQSYWSATVQMNVAATF